MEQLDPRLARQDRRLRRSGVASPAESPSRLGAYLRKLREGYGYTLRKVEEQATACGEAIDNSQLSRFEKGKAVPSFEKLCALAQVFNVPVQNFADVLDLEEYRRLEPGTEHYADLLQQGSEWIARGEPGRAYACFERAVSVAETVEDSEKRAEMVVEARWRLACSLKSLGKLFMAEQELRGILRQRHLLVPRSRLRALLQLGYLHREMGDLYLASVLSRECLDLAEQLDDQPTRAGVLNTLANILYDEGSVESAAQRYREALAVIERLEGHGEMQATVMTNLGGCLVSLGHFEEGVALLRSACARARQWGYRRVAALALTRLAEAWIQRDDRRQACQFLAESDALASRPEGTFHDILFLNAFHKWRMVRGQGNRSGEKIAFGRLRHLRSLLQRRFPEVDEFDRHVERIRR